MCRGAAQFHLGHHPQVVLRAFAVHLPSVPQPWAPAATSARPPVAAPPSKWPAISWRSMIDQSASLP
jgi:hypothetical protein